MEEKDQGAKIKDQRGDQQRGNHQEKTKHKLVHIIASRVIRSYPFSWNFHLWNHINVHGLRYLEEVLFLILNIHHKLPLRLIWLNACLIFKWTSQKCFENPSIGIRAIGHELDMFLGFRDAYMGCKFI